ncbi:hypothetical protein WJX72_010064 [[Myrmecia] bisecta]|uniref:Uncharacterized protein n=1 Tax=[Myrmecia] bisecta TaxID=41462 RepID=A0AAW1PYF2_9CHLO
MLAQPDSPPSHLCVSSRMKFEKPSFGLYHRSHGDGSHLHLPHLPSKLSKSLATIRSRRQFKGGEGITNLVNIRESDSRTCGVRHNKYWLYTICAVRGRAFPWMPMLTYSLYSILVICLAPVVNPDYRTSTTLKALVTPVNTVGLSLFLLLGFRTNSSYDRWWEGRKVWDAMTSKAQDMGRLVVARMKDKAHGCEVLRWTIAFCVAAKKVLRYEQDFSELEPILPPEDILALEQAENKTGMIILKLSRLVADADERKIIPASTNNDMEGILRGFNADINACKRILGTPMPLAYIVHLRAFLLLWLALLPFVFVVTMDYWAIPVCIVIGYELLGFEDIGVEIESPFGNDFNDLPLDQITDELLAHLAEYLHHLERPDAGEAPDPKKQAPLPAQIEGLDVKCLDQQGGFATSADAMGV